MAIFNSKLLVYRRVSLKTRALIIKHGLLEKHPHFTDDFRRSWPWINTYQSNF